MSRSSHIKLPIIYQSLGKILIDIRSEIQSIASRDLSNEIDAAIEQHRKLQPEFEPAITEIQNIASKRWHFFYKDGSEKIREDWNLQQNVETPIIKAEESRNYQQLSASLKNIAEKFKLENDRDKEQKINEAIKFLKHLPIEWDILVDDIIEKRNEFNKLLCRIPESLLESRYLKYRELLNGGGSAKDVLAVARNDQISDYEIFPLIRTLFNLSVDETAKITRLFIK